MDSLFLVRKLVRIAKKKKFILLGHILSSATEQTSTAMFVKQNLYFNVYQVTKQGNTVRKWCGGR